MCTHYKYIHLFIFLPFVWMEKKCVTVFYIVNTDTDSTYKKIDLFNLAKETHNGLQINVNNIK